MEIKLFNKWATENVAISDLGLKRYINLQPSFLPKTGGRYATKQFHRSKMNIVERLMTKVMIPGHRGKKHLISSARATGKYQIAYKIVKTAFEKIENELKKNPIEVLVIALQNAALREEIAAYQVGGIIVRRAVITSPQRRVDMGLRTLVQAAYRKSFNKKENMTNALANEIIATYKKDASKSDAIRERDRIEKEAEGAR